MIIQGGMGIAVSDWVLARAVSQQGELGVVSGTAINSVLVRRLQDGDKGGHMRRALSHFPDQKTAQEILDAYYLPEGRAPGATYKRAPMFSVKPLPALLKLTIAANFCEVWLAKEGHNGKVGINLLEKIVLPNLSSLYGAMLAGVDYVLMGAGIPREIPGALDKFVNHEEASLKLQVDGASAEDDFKYTFSPRTALEIDFSKPLKRPDFLAIVSSATLALNLAKKSTGKVNGFVIEHWTAGGHNAPPRGPMKLNEKGEPVYGERDEVDFAKFCELGLPFWLAGSAGTPDKLIEALKLGANGIQVGTAFAFCEDSGLSSEMRNMIVQDAAAGKPSTVFTDPLASPSGFPFKVVTRGGTLSEKEVYEARPRKCDLGYLRSVYKTEQGGLGLRCAAEPVDAYLKKGGKLEETQGRKCLCNGLMSVIGMGQVQESGYTEAPIITAGDDVALIKRLIKNGNKYTAADVISYLRSGLNKFAGSSSDKSRMQAAPAL
jgi:NAD(P)H-dependent flavin oxidoreductase YrpB (nitropropane dioxygenase family)